MNLDEEKRNRIINAALKEFGLNGYKGAKTDNIIQEAGISKGLLFHYFGTKKGLFDFLLDYTMDISEKYLLEINMDPDVFKRLRESTLTKLELAKKTPDLFNFLITVSQKDERSVKKEVQDRINSFTVKAYEKLFSGLDYSKFKEELDPQQCISIILWTLEGLSNKFIAIYNQYNQIQEVEHEILLKELDEYLDLLKKSFYK